MKKISRLTSLLLAFLMLFTASLTGIVSAAVAEESISEATITITPPEAGATASKDTLPQIELTSGAHYEVEACCWYQESGVWAEVNELTPYTFIAGNTYYFWVTLKAKAGYVFADNATLTVSGGKVEEDPECYTSPDQSYSCLVGTKVSVTIEASEVVSETYTITFNANGGSGTMDAVTVNKGEMYTLPACGFTAPEGKEFDGWNLGAAGDQIEITADTELTAQWKNKAAETCKITFKANGGKGKMDAIKAEKGKAVKLTANKFTQKGYAFAGWNTKKNGKGTAYKDGAKITLKKNMTLYAQWNKIALKIGEIKNIPRNKKLTVKATLTLGGKAVKGKTVTFVFKGKKGHKYTAKTNQSGVATVTIKAKDIQELKVGATATITASFEDVTTKIKAKITK